MRMAFVRIGQISSLLVDKKLIFLQNIALIWKVDNVDKNFHSKSYEQKRRQLLISEKSKFATYLDSMG